MQELLEAQDAITLLDKHLDQQLAGLPKKVIDAVASTMKARQESNHEFATITSGIALGRILRNWGTLINTATITTATVLSIIGSSISSAAYASSRAVNVSLKEAMVDCFFLIIFKVPERIVQVLTFVLRYLWVM